MPRAKKNSDEQLVEHATIRASIIGWLGANPGPHDAAAVADGIGRERPSVAQALYQLNKAGLINKAVTVDDTGKHALYSGNGHPEAEAPKVRRKFKRESVTDVELIVAGVEIVIGRNPATGRLRITLEG